MVDGGLNRLINSRFTCRGDLLSAEVDMVQEPQEFLSATHLEIIRAMRGEGVGSENWTYFKHCARPPQHLGVVLARSCQSLDAPTDMNRMNEQARHRQKSLRLLTTTCKDRTFPPRLLHHRRSCSHHIGTRDSKERVIRSSGSSTSIYSEIHTNIRGEAAAFSTPENGMKCARKTIVGLYTQNPICKISSDFTELNKKQSVPQSRRIREA